MAEPGDDGSRDLAAELRAVDEQARRRRSRNANALRLGSLLAAASFLFLLRDDLTYATRPAQPVELGGPLEFNLDREARHIFASISGVPGELAPSADRGGRHLRMFGLLGTNVMVVQDLSEAGPDSQPSRNQPFAVKGRLERDDDAFEYHAVLRILEERDIVVRQNDHLYVLLADEVPRKGLTLPLELAAIVVFVLANFVWAHRMERPVGADLSDA